MKLSASILSSNFGRLAEEVQAVERAGADWIHVDIMDGHFVPNLTIGPKAVEAVRSATELPLDVHLMIEQPERYLEDFARAGADRLGVHEDTIGGLVAAGVDVFVAGSAIFGGGDYAANIQRLRAHMNQ